MAFIILVMLIVAFFLCAIAITYLKMKEKNDKLQRAANAERNARFFLHEQYRDYRKNTANLLYERLNKIKELNSQVERMSQIICPHEAHVWDYPEPGIKRCRKCGLTRRADDAEVH